MPPISKTQLEKAGLDAESLADVINGSATVNGNGVITTRLGRNIKTLAKVIADLAASPVGDSAIAAVNARINALASRNVATVWVDDWSGITWPEGTDTVLQRRTTIGGWLQLWAKLGAAPSQIDPLIHRESAGAVWWIKVYDSLAIDATLSAITTELRDGRVYSAAGGTPSGMNISQHMDFAIIANNAGNSITFWRPVGPPADGLETDLIKRDGATPVRWWRRMIETSVTELNTALSATIAALTTELRDGRGFVLLASESPSGQNVPVSYGVDCITTIHYGTASFKMWRRILAPTNGLETDTFKKDANDTWWQKLTDRDLISEISDRQAADTALQNDYNQKINILKEPAARANGSFAVMTGPKNDGSDDILRVGKNGLIFNREGGDGGELYSDGWALASDGSFTAQAGINGINAVDRFIDRNDGVRLPVALINGTSRKAVIISGYGQSLADVTPMADPLIWQVPPFPYHGFMLDDMNAISSGNLRGGMIGWSGVPVQRGSRMINASDGLRNCQSHGAAAFSRLIHWDGKNRRVGLIRSSAWGGNRLVGTSVGTGIWKDSAGNYTQSWVNWHGDIEQAYDLLTSAGYEVDAVYILFHHQQADWQTPYASYLSDFLAMKSDKEALIESARPGLKVHWFCGQAGGSGYRTGSYLGGKWQSRLAIVDACKPENGGDNITMVMPEYWARTGIEWGGSENNNVIHIQHADRPLWGEFIAHAIHAVENGRSWNCPVMSSASVSGNNVIVNFASEWPLLIDKTFCKVRDDCGFTVNEGAITVNSITQTGQRQFTLACASNPSGTSVEYAWRQQGANDIRDDWMISTGAIREAWEAPSLFDPFGRKVIRPALAYRLSL